ncbi:MAG: hypothetical protein PHD00_10670 [Bacteroidales bacterium]|nr:hypothetical protein [Bacteroidales bacterium]MDD4673018.1 hypothetical protein [Bacteroidales bacterium]MDY0348355.1 hypothetical protein [Tenuifilaceae bacterium]
MRKVAIIDMGTNTFNLLIASVDGHSSYKILHSGKLGVKLGEGGINQKVIVPAAYERGLNAIGEHCQTVKRYGADSIYAFATSATRNAENGEQFIADIQNIHGVTVQIIDGSEEAELVYLGIRQAVELDESNVLMLDIGGGSNEIIIGNRHESVWRKSYDLGISRLLQMFNPSDPITSSEVLEVEAFLQEELSDLAQHVSLYKPETIIGSSGSFDTYRSVLSANGAINGNGEPSIVMPMDAYFALHNRLIATTAVERKAIPGMDAMRVEMIVLATIFTNYLIRRFDIKNMIQSSYALKEGAVWKMLNGN